METKLCKKCGKELPVSEFGICKRYADGLQPYCRECTNEYSRQLHARKKSQIPSGGGSNIGNPKFEGLEKYTPRTLMEYLGELGYKGELQYVYKVKIGM